MKMIFATVAALAAITTTPSLAQEATGGHYEWKVRQLPGPNKSGIVKRQRVWVKDKTSQTANCNCEMMKADGDHCMKAMDGQQMAPAKG